MEATRKPMPADAIDSPVDPISGEGAIDPHAEHIAAQLKEFREQLLGMTLRNHLLNCPHGPRVLAQVRVVDELPDAVFERLEVGDEYTFLPLPEPRDHPDDEDSDEFREALNRHKQESVTYRAAIEQVSKHRDKEAALERFEREAHDHVRLLLGMGVWEPEGGLSAEELCRRRGIEPSFDLPLSDQAEAAERHHDNALQTLLSDELLSARLGRLRDRARSSIRQTGVPTLFVAFSFLEWYESAESDLPHHAPLLLVPAELDRQLVRGRYNYRLCGTGEAATANLTLAVHLRQHFGLQLPEFDADDSPESYFTKVEDEICAHRRRWRIRRFLTIGIFAYSKLAIYEDLDQEAWPKGSGLIAHENIRTLLAQSGVSDLPYAENREIDEDEWASETPILVYDADSSQHSAIADVLSGENLTIYGPPGTGKSQTIANTIAAAMMAGKTILFVAEKLTALEVVWDRLEKAGLGPFCFNLHAQGLKAGHVRRSLAERVSMPRPDFEPSRYEQKRQAWTKQRDGLRTYARVMGAKIGRLEETVHDVLWRTIVRKGPETDLPSAISSVPLANVESIAAAEIDEARSCILRLQNAEADVIRLVGPEGGFPWRGVQHTDLPPVEVAPALHLIDVWAQTLDQLERTLCEGGLRGGTMIVRDTGFLHLAAELVQKSPNALACCDLASLTRKETRNDIARAAVRSHRLQEIGEESVRRFGIGTDELPQENDLRALSSAALSLGVSEQSSLEARSEARILRDRADNRGRINGMVIRLGTCFNFEATHCDTEETIERAIAILRGTDADLLSSRTKALCTLDARRILDRAETECREVNSVRNDLAKRFDLVALPGSEELHQATRALNAARGPLLLNAAARRAMRLYREISLLRDKRSTTEAAKDLRNLIEHREKTLQLERNEEFISCLGSHWRGADSNLTQARRVVEWTAEVFDQLAGEGDGRSEARETLLHADMERLEEIRRIAEALPSEWRHSGSELRPDEARERAALLEDLADGLLRLGLDEAMPFATAVDLAVLIEEYRSLAADAHADESLGLVFPSQTPDLQTLEMVRSLADAMSGLGLTDETWRHAAGYLPHATDTNNARLKLKEALTAESKAWLECVRSLQLDPQEFLDGGTHETTSLEALRLRAKESSNARNALLPWSIYQRARKTVGESHAATVLAALDEHDMPATRLHEAYEWALYRSLATVVYRRYPELNEISSWRLNDHRAAYQELDSRLQELERTRIAYEIHSRPVEKGISFGGPRSFTEKALIQQQLSLQRSSVTLRNLILRAGTALRQLKPCVMMSPTTVAELLPRDSKLFDIVIIDEASQMLPCDALGSIARGRQAVVVGDPKQLPPSTYFQGSSAGITGDDDDDDDHVLARVVESILDLSLSAWHPPRYLQWHYRSRHSSLIQFSNVHFYDNRLIVFPGPDEDREDNGIRYHHVSDGLAKAGLNRVEAQRVVSAACAFMEDSGNRDLSLAIVAMNQKQRDYINELLDRETAQNQAVDRYRRHWRNTLYPFIVRNLETVQGDERDVIYISTVYGRETAGGPVMRRFGPITHAGGERRLNVLFSRARQRMEVFSSMQANDIAIGPGVSEGVRILREYLEYAATGRIESGADTGRGPESPFEDYVMERLCARGLEVVPQVGVAGYRIDLGIRHPEYPHGYLLGVECDGRTYHSALSVRDRDRLREAVLRDLGWDLYRIWSTDWFKDSDHELNKLMEYIDARIEDFRAGPAVDDAETILIGDVIEQSPDFLIDTTSPNKVPDSLEDEHPYVRVSDTVSYREAGRDHDTRRVTIVRGVDDPSIGVINDNKPLAIALLGAEVGETVTVRQPTSELDIEVVGIDRPDSEAREPRAAAAFTELEDVELAPYPEWRSHAPDPRSATLDEVAEALLGIVNVEGPVLESRAYQAYIRASGAQRLGPQIRRILNRALAKLEREKHVIVERVSRESGYRNALLRTPETDQVRMREIGPRAFDEVPLSEISALVRRVRSANPGADVSGCVKARISGEQGIRHPAICGAGDDSERWVSI